MGNQTVLHVIRSASWGGLELYVYTLIKKLHEQGIKQAFYVAKGSILAKKLTNDGFGLNYAKSSAKLSVGDVIALRKLVNASNYSAIHVHVNKDIPICSLALVWKKDCRLIFGLYMNVIAKKNPWHTFIYSRLDAIVSTSETINNQVKQNYPIAPEKVKLVRYGRDVDSYVRSTEKREAIRSQWGVASHQTIIGTMCRIDPSKGVRELASSFLLLPKVVQEKTVVWIIGERTISHTLADGTVEFEQASEETYRWLIDFISSNQLQNSIKVIPFQQDLIGYLSAFDVFVLASYNEMYALAVLDAMLMELPVIGTNAGGTPEQLANGRGTIVEAKSSSSIASAIQSMAQDETNRQDMGKKGRAWVLKEHSWKNALTTYIELYQIHG